jgi:hypothetical protein
VAAVVAPGASAPCERALASHFDYRGRYGTHQLALFVDAAAADLHAFNLTEVPLHTSLDGPAAARLWALVAHAPTAHDMAALRAAVGAYPHVTVHDVTLALLPPAVGGRDWPATFEDIPVPRRRVRLAGRFEDSPLHKFVAKRQYNEVIAAAVARVSQAELLATDTYLSSEEIWTRQSASEGLLAAGTYLQSRLRAYGLSVTTFQYSGTYGPVIVAELPGRVRDQYVMVGAHYDSRTTNSADPTARAPGADDNGSGTSAIVEIARIMTSQNTSYEFTVRFLLFSGEEQVRLCACVRVSIPRHAGALMEGLWTDPCGYRVRVCVLRACLDPMRTPTRSSRRVSRCLPCSTVRPMRSRQPVPEPVPVPVPLTLAARPVWQRTCWATGFLGTRSRWA